MKKTMFLLFLSAMFIPNTALPLPLGFNVTGQVSTAKTPVEVIQQIIPAVPGEPVVKSGLTHSQLVALGRFIFNNVQFNGNGRTCATCHPARNNFTIDPQFIATLPQSDPLFVAENNPALVTLENPVLLRTLGLICENIDGFNQPCRFRGVPHTLALRTSTTPPLANPPNPGNVLVPGTDPPVELANSTGWSGDGAPIGDGARGELRLFAVGAVTQHFTKTLNRVPGIDFRVPSDLELDAILEFMLATGRQADVPLKDEDTFTGLVFNNAVAEFGKKAFQDQDINTGARCSLCHDNAGANRPPTNANVGRNTLADTRVELTVNTPAYLLEPGVIFVDGGFGKPPVLSPDVPLRVPVPAFGFGNGQFKAPPLIEAAATPPFFHNNMAPTLEAAISFFGSPEFNQPNVIIKLDADKVAGLSSFLRAISSMEHIDRTIQNNLDARDQPVPLGGAFIDLSIKNSNDALKVLRDGVVLLYPQVQNGLNNVIDTLKKANLTNVKSKRDALLSAANVSLTSLKIQIADVE